MVSIARSTRPGTFRSSSRTAIHRTASWCDSFTEKSLREPVFAAESRQDGPARGHQRGNQLRRAEHRYAGRLRP